MIEALNFAIRLGDRLEALEKKPLTSTEGLLLVHLCNHVDGQWRWESDKKTLARRCFTSPRTIQSGLKKFQRWGLISLRRNVGHRGQDADGFEFWVHEEALKLLDEQPEVFFAAVEARSENISTPGNTGLADISTPENTGSENVSTPGNSGSADISTPGIMGSENISHPHEGLWITGLENSSTPGNTRLENISTLAGSEISARSDVENFHPQRARTSFKPSRVPSYSSSPPHGLEPDTQGESTAAAVGEDEPLRGADSVEGRDGSSAASGDETTSPRAGQPAAAVVDAGQVQEMLSAVDTSEVSLGLTQAFIDLVLGRSKESTINQPSRFVAAAIRNSPARTREDLSRLRNQGGGATASSGGPEPATRRPVSCPIPAHAEAGRLQANCPDCRGITGEFTFPKVLSREVFDQLLDWQQRNVLTCGVDVADQVDSTAMRGAVIHHRPQGSQGREQSAEAAA